MLPKMWKKVLLAVCIIACLFNVMSKLVNRNSLEINLKSVNDGNTIWDSLKKDNKETTSDTIEGVHTNTSLNTTENNITSEDEYLEEQTEETDIDSRDDSFVVEL